MVRLCGWCNKFLDEVETYPADEITHGICESCRVALLSSREPLTLSRFLNYFTLPVMIINPETEVLSANEAALDLVGRDLNEVSHQFSGDVMSCKYAFQEDGCGKTVHCIACAIRISIIQTFETGKSLHKVPAYLMVVKNGQEIGLDFLISTEKVDDVVLLRVDEDLEQTE